MSSKPGVSSLAESPLPLPAPSSSFIVKLTILQKKKQDDAIYTIFQFF
jgi:hypothetical protein